MRLLVDRTLGHRRQNAGSILLESLIAFAALAAFALVAMLAIANSLDSQSDRADRYWLAEYARSKIEEFAITGLPAPGNGVDGNHWAWRASEQRVWPDSRSRFDNDIALYEMSLTVWAIDVPAASYTASSIIGRQP